MITFDNIGRPIFTARPLSGKQFHNMREFVNDCDYTPEELAWFSKFKDNENAAQY